MGLTEKGRETERNQILLTFLLVSELITPEVYTKTFFFFFILLMSICGLLKVN